jgi:hypothetical protein
LQIRKIKTTSLHQDLIWYNCMDISIFFNKLHKFIRIYWLWLNRMYVWGKNYNWILFNFESSSILTFDKLLKVLQPILFWSVLVEIVIVNKPYGVAIKQQQQLDTDIFRNTSKEYITFLCNTWHHLSTRKLVDMINVSVIILISKSSVNWIPFVTHHLCILNVNTIKLILYKTVCVQCFKICFNLCQL